MDRAKHDPEGLDRDLAAIDAAGDLHGPLLTELHIEIRTLNRYLGSARNTLRRIYRETRDPRTRATAERGLKNCGTPRKY